MSEMTDDVDHDDKLYRKIMRKLLPILFFSYVIAYIDKVNISFAKLQMMSDLKFSDVVYGFGAGIFFVGFTLIQIPSNLILYRVGARTWLARIMIAWGILSVLMMFAHSPTTFYSLRFLLGAAEAGFLPGVLYYMTLWFPTQRRGRVFSIFTSGSAVGGIVVGPLSGWIMVHLNGAAGLRGWEWLFVLQGGTAVVIGVLLFCLLSDSPQTAKWISEEDRGRLLAQLGDTEIASESRSGSGIAFRDPRVWLLGLILGVTNLGIYLGVFWLPTIIRNAGIANLQAIGFLTSTSYLGAALAMLGLGWSSDRFQERRWHVAITLIVAALALVAGANFSGSPGLGIGGVVISTALFIGVTPVLWVHASSFIEGKTAATGFALINVCAGVAAFLAPYLMGVVQERFGSTDPVLFGVAACVTAGAIVLVGVPMLSPAKRPSLGT